jgi:peroxiredoxin
VELDKVRGAEGFVKRALIAVPDQAASSGTPSGIRRESRPACPAKPGGDELSPAASARAERHAERARVQGLIGQALPDVDLECSADLCRDSDTAIERYVAYYFYPGSRVPSGTGRESPAADRVQHRAFALYAAQLAAEHVRVVGVSTETPKEMYATRNANHVAHDLLSDPQLELANALALPTFYDAPSEQRYRRLLLLTKAKTIEWVSYPVDDPTAGPRQILTWLQFNT